MTNNSNPHVDDDHLRLLVFGDEDTDDYRITAAHVETCADCRRKLDLVSGPEDIDAETRQLLGGGSFDSLDTAEAAGASDGGHLEDRVSPVSTDELLAPGFLSAPGHPELLGRLGRYDVERVIGSGGMGVVLKAFDTELNRPVAVKVLAQHLSHRGAARQRFAREAKAAAAVVHEHVVAIHNVEAERDEPYLVMQYVAGESLQARVDQTGPLDTKQILRIGIQAAAGLAAAHEQGVVHRDIKPANILLEQGVERVLLTDFGLARTVDDATLTHTGIVAGTPHYMSPEQAGGDATDHRTDLFSLGSVLYFMATGQPPFRAERAMGVLHRICHGRQRPAWEHNADIPDELSDIIDRLLEKRPARRFASAAAVRDALTRLLARMQQRGFLRRRRSVRLVRRHPVLAAAAVLLLGTAIVAPLARTPAPSPEQSASELSGAGASGESRGPLSGPFGPTRPTGSVSINKRSQDSPVNPAVTVPDAAASNYFLSSTEAREVSARIDHLESASSDGRFASRADDFWQSAESLEARLDRLESGIRRSADDSGTTIRP